MDVDRGVRPGRSLPEPCRCLAWLEHSTAVCDGCVAIGRKPRGEERMRRAVRASILALLAFVLMVGAPAVAVAQSQADLPGSNAVLSAQCTGFP